MLGYETFSSLLTYLTQLDMQVTQRARSRCMTSEKALSTMFNISTRNRGMKVLQKKLFCELNSSLHAIEKTQNVVSYMHFKSYVSVDVCDVTKTKIHPPT